MEKRSGFRVKFDVKVYEPLPMLDYPVPGSLSVRTIEKAGGRRAGSGRDPARR